MMLQSEKDTEERFWLELKHEHLEAMTACLTRMTIKPAEEEKS